MYVSRLVINIICFQGAVLVVWRIVIFFRRTFSLNEFPRPEFHRHARPKGKSLSQVQKRLRDFPLSHARAAKHRLDISYHYARHTPRRPCLSLASTPQGNAPAPSAPLPPPHPDASPHRATGVGTSSRGDGSPPMLLLPRPATPKSPALSTRSAN